MFWTDPIVVSIAILIAIIAGMNYLASNGHFGAFTALIVTAIVVLMFVAPYLLLGLMFGILVLSLLFT